MKKINMAIVGLGFGSEFIPIYQNHPHVNMYAICQRSEMRLKQIGDYFGVEKRYTSYEELLQDPEVDAVHINTPIPEHASQSIAALQAGKHTACTVPMATTVEECATIVQAQKASGKKYMMMETAVYTREYLYVQQLYTTGKLGRIQFLRGAHQQEMAGWPGYWEGLPPMYYATHCVGPCLGLTGKQADYVSCFGSGRIDEHLIGKYGSPFAVETAHIRLKDSDLAVEVTRSLFNTARQYVESFDVYGSKLSFEWTRVENGASLLHTGEQVEQVNVPDFAELLPASIRKYTTQGVYGSDGNSHLSFTQGSGHGGSHPHLAHEFVMSIMEDREPFPNALQSANWTSTGICSHESAMDHGKIVKLPDFS
jgi:predicted dehydrogenase